MIPSFISGKQLEFSNFLNYNYIDTAYKYKHYKYSVNINTMFRVLLFVLIFVLFGIGSYVGISLFKKHIFWKQKYLISKSLQDIHEFLWDNYINITNMMYIFPLFCHNDFVKKAFWECVSNGSKMNCVFYKQCYLNLILAQLLSYVSSIESTFFLFLKETNLSFAVFM